VQHHRHRAAARAHLKTGLAITTHALESPVGLQQLDLFEEEGADLRRLLEDEGVRNTLVDSQRWDLRLGYVRREACEHLLTRYSGDAEREAAVAAASA